MHIQKMSNLILNNRSHQDVLQIYNGDISKLPNLVLLHSTIYGPTSTIEWLSADKKENDLKDLLATTKIAQPWVRIDQHGYPLAFDNIQFIPGDITLLYKAQIRQAFKIEAIEIAEIKEYDSHLVQQVVVDYDFKWNSQVKYLPGLYNRDTTKTLKTTSGNNGNSLTLFTPNFQPFVRLNFITPSSGTHLSFYDQDVKFPFSKKVDKEDAKYYMNLLEENRLRIMRDKPFILRENGLNIPMPDCTELMAYDIVYQQLNLILDLLERGLITTKNPSLEDLHRIFIANLNTGYFIRPPLSLYIYTINFVRMYWTNFLNNPELLNSYAKMYDGMKRDSKFELVAGEDVYRSYSKIVITEDILVANPSKIYDKHPTSTHKAGSVRGHVTIPVPIDNVIEIEGKLYYQHPIRDPHNRVKGPENWNMKLEEINNYPWVIYHGSRPYHFYEADEVTYKTFQEAEEEMKSKIDDNAWASGELMVNLTFLYSPTLNYNVPENEIWNFRYIPSEDKKVVFAISTHGIWFITKGKLEEREHLPQIFTELEAEEELHVAISNFKYITLHGICFLASDLRLFYNSFLYDTIVGTGEANFDLPNLSLKDLRLMRDVLAGRISFLYFYSNLSAYAYAQLSAKRTLLDIYDFIPARYYIDHAYVIGVPLRQQLKAIQIAASTGVIKRLEEVINL